MSLQQFLNNTCTITKTTKTVDWWESTKTTEEVYTDIKCYYYWKITKLNETGLSENTELNKYRVILESSNTDIKSWMYITIKDQDLWDIGRFLIISVKMNRLSDWTKDSIELNIKNI